MKINDLIDKKQFPRRLKLGMLIADIRACELADKTGISEVAIYRIRSKCRSSTEDERTRMLYEIERWRPGTLDAIRAVERELSEAYVPPLRSHSEVVQRALTQ